MRKHFVFSVVLCLVAFGTVGFDQCWAATNNGGSSDYNPVNITANLDNMTLSVIDPQLAPGTNKVFLQMIFNGLMRINPDTLKPECDLAESYEISGDGLVYTFKLRKGVQFHHGYGEMTAEDVVFSLLRVRDGASSGQYTAYFSGVQEVEAMDPYTVRVRLKEITPDFLQLVTDDIPGSFIVSKKAFDELGEKGFAKKAVGTGPFVFSETEWLPQQSSRYISFKDYFNGAPKVNVKMTEIKDGSTALLAMQNKEIDFLLSSQLEIVTQAEQSGAVVNFFKAPIMFALFFNGNVYEPFKNPKVREAIFHAIDRETNRKIVFGNYLARSMQGVLPEVLKGFTMDGVKTYEYNPALSKKLLEEAGYTNKVKFTALFQNNVRNERIFTLLQKNLADVGITMNLQPVSTAEYYSASENRKVACSYSSIAGFNIYFILSQTYQGKQLRNYTDYSGCDTFIETMAKTNDGPERDELYKQAQIKLSEDMPFFPHHAVNIIMINNPRLHGVYSKGGNGGDVRFDKAYIE